MSESIFQSGVLYQKPKQSDMLEGILDGMQLIALEWDKYLRFYPDTGEGSWIYNVVNQIRNNDYMLRNNVSALRKRGL